MTSKISSFKIALNIYCYFSVCTSDVFYTNPLTFNGENMQFKSCLTRQNLQIFNGLLDFSGSIRDFRVVSNHSGHNYHRS